VSREVVGDVIILVEGEATIQSVMTFVLKPVSQSGRRFLFRSEQSQIDFLKRSTLDFHFWQSSETSTYDMFTAFSRNTRSLGSVFQSQVIEEPVDLNAVLVLIHIDIMPTANRGNGLHQSGWRPLPQSVPIASRRLSIGVPSKVIFWRGDAMRFGSDPNRPYL